MQQNLITPFSSTVKTLKFNTIMEYRLYGKPDCNLFSLLGDKEPDQTKGLGLVLSESKEAMKAFLDLIRPTFPRLTPHKLLQCNCIVDCELIQPLNSSNSYRADIVISFYDNYQPSFAVVIEAKSVNIDPDPHAAQQQLHNYVEKFTPLKSFGNNISEVVLTNTKINSTLSSGIFITWGEVIDALEKVHGIIVNQYLKYLTKINGNMKHYTHEVMSIPTGMTYNLIKKNLIYICPAQGKHYEARSKEKPLFIACRQRGGIIKELFKIKDIIRLDLAANNGSYVNQYDQLFLSKEFQYLNLEDKIKAWCTESCFKGSRAFKDGSYFVFILEDFNNGSIVLPNNGVKDKGKQGNGVQNHTFPKLSAILSKSMQSTNNTLDSSNYE